MLKSSIADARMPRRFCWKDDDLSKARLASTTVAQGGSPKTEIRTLPEVSRTSNRLPFSGGSVWFPRVSALPP